MHNIELHIDNLVLHGFSPHDRHRIGAAVEHQLTQILAKQGITSFLSKGGELSHLDGGTFDMAPNTKPGTIGAQVAKSVYAGLKSERKVRVSRDAANIS
ncbi:MAG: hypothetical protein D8M57_18975 [Candidatus Scalindua sp. AMX11]|nr:hypothetical protein [Planctomycetota bacterium]RZV62007.1 MAG: hypothetical protein EX341_18700 [Candidatus Scalindua sp. SCAELEC01]TDE63302.1 MAG: hypothetical protein D8M57_18975 [Candidatus Scalindua sp. AMX11]GJQ57398.1 MAG: hypothetical protein SCALA701_01990 [Candidatus Scalindua sp.]